MNNIFVNINLEKMFNFKQNKYNKYDCLSDTNIKICKFWFKTLGIGKKTTQQVFSS